MKLRAMGVAIDSRFFELQILARNYLFRIQNILETYLKLLEIGPQLPKNTSRPRRIVSFQGVTIIGIAVSKRNSSLPAPRNDA